MDSLVVIIPVSGHGRYLHQAVSSALQHDVLPIEVLVVMNGANPKCHDEISKLGDEAVTVISLQQPVGAAFARNIGIARSTANWIRFLDADDVFLPGSTSQLLAQIRDPHCEVAVGRMRLLGEDGGHIRDLDDASPVIGAVLCSRTLFNMVGAFDETLKLGEYIDWVSRARDCGVREIQSDYLVLGRRIHRDNTSTLGLRAKSLDYLRVARSHLERNR